MTLTEFRTGWNGSSVQSRIIAFERLMINSGPDGLLPDHNIVGVDVILVDALRLFAQFEVNYDDIDMELLPMVSLQISILRWIFESRDVEIVIRIGRSILESRVGLYVKVYHEDRASNEEQKRYKDDYKNWQKDLEEKWKEYLKSLKEKPNKPKDPSIDKGS